MNTEGRQCCNRRDCNQIFGLCHAQIILKAPPCECGKCDLGEKMILTLPEFVCVQHREDYLSRRTDWVLNRVGPICVAVGLIPPNINKFEINWKKPGADDVKSGIDMEIV